MQCNFNFYPRSPCGERQSATGILVLNPLDFYPRSPCGERPPPYNLMIQHTKISIHALLAESDADRYEMGIIRQISIHALLAESDLNLPSRPIDKNISIHALLAESDKKLIDKRCKFGRFLSTLSLRRATQTKQTTKPTKEISIHALLAESDTAFKKQLERIHNISIHALLAESDIPPITFYGKTHTFLSTLSLRRATCFSPWLCLSRSVFLSTLSLRRATSTQQFLLFLLRNFYPRSPCGERPDHSHNSRCSL